MRNTEISIATIVVREVMALSPVVDSTMLQNVSADGVSVRALKGLAGGELREYSDMINEARAIATKRMVEEATELGADAVINLRYATSAVMQGAAEVLAYGTAVTFK